MIDTKQHIGHLKHRVQLLKADGTSDGMGGTNPSYASITTVWAKVTPINTDERARVSNIDSSITHEIVTRFRDDLTSQGASTDRVSPNMIIRYDGREFGIKGVYDMDEERKFVKIVAAEQ